jgi:hypothetical protein
MRSGDMRWNALFIVSSMLAPLGVGCGDSTAPPPAPVPVQFAADLNAANELRTPPVNSTATGRALIVLSGDTLSYTITATGLTARVTASHIHIGTATTVSGPVVNGFQTNAVTTGTVASGSILLSTLVVAPNQISGDSLRKLLNTGNAYVNVHTSTNPGGEIRGQLAKL